MAVRAAFTPFFVRPGSPYEIIVMDVHSTICKPYATLSDTQHSLYAVNIKLLQLSVKFAGGKSFTHKNRHEPLRGSTSRMSLTLHIGLPIDIIWLTLAPPVACYHFYKCCHLPRNKMLAEYQSYNLGNLTIEYTSCSPYRLRVSLLQKLFCISYRFNDTTQQSHSTF
jgi:hypothetical protein